MSHTPSELLLPESSVSDGELRGELLDTLARSSCQRLTPFAWASVTLVGDVGKIVTATAVLILTL